jgi:hypothetical protein
MGCSIYSVEESAGVLLELTEWSYFGAGWSYGGVDGAEFRWSVVELTEQRPAGVI